MPKPSSKLLLVGGLALLVGCAPSLEGNEPREVKKAVPSNFGASPVGDSTSSFASKKWGEVFKEPELGALIDAALSNNQELNVRMQEIVIAAAEVSAKQGEILPKLDAFAHAGVDKNGAHTSQGKSDDANGLPENLGSFRFGLVASWELDIWGKLRSAKNAAGFRYLAAVEGRKFMVTQLVAEIARSYYELIAVDRQIEVLNRNIGIQKDALEVVKLQKQAAKVSELAVQRFEAEVLKNRSRLFDLEQERVQAENRINFLVGRFPQPVARNAERFDDPVPSAIQTGLPSQLLENRPDVKQAELELEASKLDVKSARAAFYPSLSIEAGVGYESFNAAHLVKTPESMFYNLAGNLTAPLLNRAAITAQYRTANAKQLQAVFNYERTLLQAFTDVVNQLAVFDNLKKSYELQEQQVEALTHSVEISGVLFQTARADYMEVLLTRRDFLEAEMDLIETKKRQLLSIVNVYQALGGGWRQKS